MWLLLTNQNALFQLMVLTLTLKKLTSSPGFFLIWFSFFLFLSSFFIKCASFTFYFVISMQLTGHKDSLKNCWRLNSNPDSLVPEATALPTVPHQMPLSILFLYKSFLDFSLPLSTPFSLKEIYSTVWLYLKSI